MARRCPRATSDEDLAQTLGALCVLSPRINLLSRHLAEQLGPIHRGGPRRPPSSLGECIAAAIQKRYWLSSLPRRRRSDGVLSRRLLLCRRPPPSAPRHAILSSHLGQRPDRQRRWFEALRLAAEQLPDGGCWLTAPTTTAHAWLTHLARDLDQPVFAFEIARRDHDLTRWFRRSLRRLEDDSGPAAFGCISPPIPTRVVPGDSAPVPRSPSDVAGLFPMADLALIEMADVCHVLKLRAGGRLETILRHAVEDERVGPTLRLAAGPSLVPSEAVSDLCGRGARLWWRFEPERARRTFLGPPSPATFLDIGALGNHGGMYLSHCTRGEAAPWPNQSWDAYYGDLIWDRPGADHDHLAALLRILTTGRLAGSARGIRGAFRVVCFSQWEWTELARGPVYRRHRRRWDASGYGLAIKKQWLADRGARPVIYGSDADWESLPHGDRPFFQLRTTRTGTCDWRHEREWRIQGDLPLHEVPAETAVVFVPSPREARIVSYFSRWPVVVLHS